MKLFNRNTLIKTLPLMLSGMLMAGQGQAMKWSDCVTVDGISMYEGHNGLPLRLALDMPADNGCNLTNQGNCAMFCMPGKFSHTRDSCVELYRTALAAMMTNTKVMVYYDETGATLNNSLSIMAYKGYNGQCQ